MAKTKKTRSTSTLERRIFVTVLRGCAEVDPGTVPRGIVVEVIDLDALKDNPEDAKKYLSPEAQAYARELGFL